MKHTKANAFVMGDAILEEGKAANEENRIPNSSNAIAIFRKKSEAKLSTRNTSSTLLITMKIKS